MRKALNDNPMVQIAVLALAAVAFAVILFTMVLKKDEPATDAASTLAPTTATTATTPVTTDPAAAAATPTTAAPATETPAATGAVPGAPATTAPPAGGTPADGLLPSKGLPEDVLVAFAKNQTIALLVVDKHGQSDKQVKRYTELLRSRDDVEVFIVDVKNIANYARITAGVNVSRTPALVVIRPRKLTGSVPTASVSYGFRGPRSVDQAIHDAGYKGKQLPSYP